MTRPHRSTCAACAHSPGQQLPETSAIFTKHVAASPRNAAAHVARARASIHGMDFADGDGTDRSHEHLDEPSDRERLRMAPQATPRALHRRARSLIEEAHRDSRPPAVLEERRTDDAVAIVLDRVVRRHRPFRFR
jgi:hypothetical protein